MTTITSICRGGATLALALAVGAGAQDVELISGNGSATDSGNGASGQLNGFAPIISNDGRYVPFMSEADDLGANDTNGTTDVYLRDRTLETTELISVRVDGTDSGNGESRNPSISDDGRLVVFASDASDLVDGDDNGQIDLFVRDRTTQTTSALSVRPDGSMSQDGGVQYGFLSRNGATVIFVSTSHDLVAIPTPADINLYARDLATAETQLVNVRRDGLSGTTPFIKLLFEVPVMSDDGSKVLFHSTDADVVDTPTAYALNLFVRDLQTQTTTLVNLRADGTAGSALGAHTAVISGDGRYVAFASDSSDFGPTDTNGVVDFYLRDLRATETHLITGNRDGSDSADRGAFVVSGVPPSIDFRGTTVVYTSLSTDLTPVEDDGESLDAFVFDRRTGRNRMLGLTPSGTRGNGLTLALGLGFVSLDGRLVAFGSSSSDLTSEIDINDDFDTFVYDRRTDTTFLADAVLGGGSTPMGGSGFAATSGDGTAVLFALASPDLVAVDTNEDVDLFVYEVPQLATVPIPTIDIRGVATFTLLLLVAGPLALRRRRNAAHR